MPLTIPTITSDEDQVEKSVEAAPTLGTKISSTEPTQTAPSKAQLYKFGKDVAKGANQAATTPAEELLMSNAEVEHHQQSHIKSSRKTSQPS